MSEDWASINTASKMKETLKRLIIKIIDDERPPYRQATVISADFSARKALVIFQNEVDPVPVAITSAYPRVGQNVLVGGLPGDRHIIETVGLPAGVGDSIVKGYPEFLKNNAFIYGIGDDYMETYVNIPKFWDAYDVDMWWQPTANGFSGDQIWYGYVSAELTGLPSTPVTQIWTETLAAGAAVVGTNRKATMIKNCTEFGAHSITFGHQGSDVLNTFDANFYPNLIVIRQAE